MSTLTIVARVCAGLSSFSWTVLGALAIMKSDANLAMLSGPFFSDWAAPVITNAPSKTPPSKQTVLKGIYSALDVSRTLGFHELGLAAVGWIAVADPAYLIIPGLASLIVCTQTLVCDVMIACGLARGKGSGDDDSPKTSPWPASVLFAAFGAVCVAAWANPSQYMTLAGRICGGLSAFSWTALGAMAIFEKNSNLGGLGHGAVPVWASPVTGKASSCFSVAQPGDDSEISRISVAKHDGYDATEEERDASSTAGESASNADDMNTKGMYAAMDFSRVLGFHEIGMAACGWLAVVKPKYLLFPGVASMTVCFCMIVCDILISVGMARPKGTGDEDNPKISPWPANVVFFGCGVVCFVAWAQNENIFT